MSMKHPNRLDLHDRLIRMYSQELEDETMETELKYRSKYKMIKVETLDQEMKLEEFLYQLYPMNNDRQLVIL